MTEENFPLFNPNDFESIEVEGAIHNLTSNTKIMDKAGGRHVGSKPDLLKNFVLEVEEQGLIMSLPKGSCAPGHGLKLDVNARKGTTGELTHFSSTAKVVDVKKEDNSDWVSIRLVQFEQASWDKFLWLFRERQEEILDYFMKVKDV